VPGRFEDTLPQLEWLLVQHQRHCWLQWRELVDELLPHRQRRRLRSRDSGSGRSSPGAGPCGSIGRRRPARTDPRRGRTCRTGRRGRSSRPRPQSRSPTPCFARHRRPWPSCSTQC
jgi:hypothetical protein